MATLAFILSLIVAIEHFYILYLEMFAIDSPNTKRIFNLTEDFLQQPKVKVMFANQGLYNSFLGAGILFGYAIDNIATVAFFLSCVLIAGIYGAVTANRSIFIKQGLPALLALLALACARF